jgi:broad specificity phosphatase PhoE
LGLQRAEKWANTLKHIPFDEIYSTNYNRTIETVQTIAKQRQKEIKIYDPDNFDLTNFLTMTTGKTVLIVGHSNTIPGLVNKIIEKDKYDQIKDYNNSNLYIIYSKRGKISDALLVIE